MKQRMIGMICMCLLLPGVLCSEEGATQSQNVTIEEAVALAMENNIQLESKAIDVRIKKRGMDSAWNVFLPSVQATGTLARTNSDTNPSAGLFKILYGMQGLEYDGTLTEKNRWTAMGGLSASLNINLALFEGLKATRQNYETGRLTYEQAKKETERDVRKAFYGILLQEGSLNYAKDKLANSEERLKQTRINYKNGLVSELSYLQAQLSVETQKPAIKEAELNLAQQKNFFAFILGLPVGTKIELVGTIAPEIESFNADELVGKHLGNRLDVALLKANIDMVDIQLRATKLQMYTPTIALSQSFSPVLSAIDANWMDTNNWTDSSGAFSLTLAFNLTNLLPFSTTGQTLAETKDNAQKLKLAMRQTLYSGELEIRNLVEKLDKSRTSIDAMELNVSIAQKAYRLTEEGYRAGSTEYLDLKDAENSLLQAQIGVLSEKFTYLSTLLDLEYALNANPK